MGRVKKRDRQRILRESQELLGVRISVDFNERAKALAAVNKGRHKEPATVKSIVQAAIGQYMQDREKDQLSEYRFISFEKLPIVIKFWISKKLYQDIRDCFSENEASRSGPISLSELANISLYLYLKNAEEELAFIDEHPEYEDGYKARGE